MIFAEFVKGFVQVRFVVDHSKMFPDKDLSVSWDGGRQNRDKLLWPFKSSAGSYLNSIP